MSHAVSIMKRFSPRIAMVMLIALSAGCLNIDTTEQGVAVLTVASGNDQTLQVNATNAAPLVVRVFDAGATPLEGVDVTWSVNPANGGTLSSTTTTTDDAGFTQVNFTPGSTPGTVFVRASTSGLTVSFTITVVTATA
jgi:hypothetical protein